MRPIKRGISPKKFTNYEDAKPYLVEKLGLYCSYCERRILTYLAVEHIQPQSLQKYHHLKNEWTNFLLSCVNCNSTKQAKDVILSEHYLPDRDNTAVPYQYEQNGRVAPSGKLTTARQRAIAQATIDLVGLNKYFDADPDLMKAALERYGQRQAAQVGAEEAARIFQANNTDPMCEIIGILSAASGFFSIWMKVFENNPEVRRQIILHFPGTAENCFDVTTTLPISPRNPIEPGLVAAGKI
jgi:uncharacterized protein (TIGR02646 family)